MLKKTQTQLLYLMIGLFIACSSIYYVMGVIGFFQRNYDPGKIHPAWPFVLSEDDGLSISALGPNAGGEAAGLRIGDRVVGLQGEPFQGRNQYLRLLGGGTAALHPGNTLNVRVRRDDHAELTVNVKLVSRKSENFHDLLVPVPLLLLPPLMCLIIGYWVILARPRDGNAWLLMLLLSMTEVLFIQPNWWSGVWLVLLGFWYTVLQATGAMFLLLFGVYFPERWRLDAKFPYLKWLIVALMLIALPGIVVMAVVQGYYALTWDSTLAVVNLWTDRILSPLNLLCVVLYCLAVLDKLRSATTADARRRMRVVCAGSIVGLGALVIVFVALPHFMTDERKLQPIRLIGALLTMMFPLSLAYVVLVQRALDVRILLRIGTRYALARATLITLEAAFAIFIVVRFLIPVFDKKQNLVFAIPVTALVVAGLARVFASRNSLNSRLQLWLDRKFFREAYNAEVVLSELSEQARGFTEAGPLIETISRRISEVLHVPEVAVFLRGGGEFQLQQAVGVPMQSALAFSEASSTIRNLARSKQPATLYREDPDGWFLLADAAERRTLDTLHAELLLPLAGRDKLFGMMTLGAKRSEEAYSPADMRLLQSVTTQAGLSLEISALVKSLAQQATARERIDREIEIAREVQERLFPQDIPVIAGLTLAGGCRAAQGVGGDYYDFIAMEDGMAPNGMLGLAIGDISGKGISAALLMASLRASLRGVTMDGSDDLAKVIRKVNRLVYEASEDHRYATFFFATYDPVTRVMRYVNAGHNSPIVLRETTGGAPYTLLLDGGGPVIGLLQDASYEEQQVKLEPGDLFIGYTDGISEAMTRADEEWGEDRMVAAAASVSAGQAEAILKHVFEQADAFTAGAPQHDDMTLLLMKLRSSAG